jgi:hypothetical protein
MACKEPKLNRKAVAGTKKKQKQIPKTSEIIRAWKCHKTKHHYGTT